MAVTQNSYTGNNSTTTYSFTFPYLKTSEIKASLDGTVTTAFSTPTATTVQFNTAPGSGVKIKIYRETDTDSLAATFYAGSSIKSQDLNDNFTQNLYTTQEVSDRYVSKLGGSVMEGDLTFGKDTKLIFEGATDDAHETTLTVADPTADRTITLPNVTGTVVTTGDTGTVATAMIANDAINGNKIANTSIDSEHYVAASIDTEHIKDAQVTTAKIADSNVTTAKIADLNVTTAKIANDAVTGAKIADDQINSEHYVDGSIDTAHIADDQVTAAKLANTSVSAGTYTATDLTVDAQGRITAASSGTIATSEIANDAITNAKIADDSIDSEHYVDGSIDTAHIGDAQVTHVKLSNDCIDGDNIQDDIVNSEHIAAGALDNEHYAAGSITADKLDAATVITASEQASATTNDTSFLTSAAADARFFNISTGDTIKDGVTFPDNDTTIATTAAINDRIIDLVDDVGGFVPIANETSFPTANPDVNNGAGTLVSIKALSSNLVSNGSGVATIANGAGSGNTVTINGLANSTTYAATYGLIVETTSTLHTYTFHRQVPKATEVTTVAGSVSNVNTVAGAISNVNAVASNATNINTVAGANSNITTVAGNNSNITTVATNISDVNNFADLYQIATSAPTQDGGGNSLSTGDLWYDSSSNKALMIYDGSAGDGFSAATPTASVLQDIAIVSGQLTFVEDLGGIADSLTTGTGNNINTVASGISNVNTVAGISANVSSVAGISSDVTTVAGAVSNINTTVSNLASINNFAEVYRIASSAPSSSLHEGDLWYDSTGNVLKYYNGTTWTVTAAAGLSNVVEDTTPELGGHLDCNDKNLTEVGTVSGDNLQIDFGTLS